MKRCQYEPFWCCLYRPEILESFGRVSHILNLRLNEAYRRRLFLFGQAVRVRDVSFDLFIHPRNVDQYVDAVLLCSHYTKSSEFLHQRKRPRRFVSTSCCRLSTERATPQVNTNPEKASTPVVRIHWYFSPSFANHVAKSISFKLLTTRNYAT